MNFHRTTAARPAALTLIATLLTGGLVACGGGSESSTTVAPQDSASAAAVDTTATAAVAGVDLAQVEMKPLFHMAPADVAEPDDTDVGGTNVSASSAPRSFTVDPALADVDTARLTLPMLASRVADVRKRAAAVSAESVSALASW